MGKWDKAINIAENYDKINLKNTFYRYAKFLESEGEYEKAIVFYQKSGNHGFEVPRMLMGHPDLLSKHVEKSEDSVSYINQY